MIIAPKKKPGHARFFPSIRREINNHRLAMLSAAIRGRRELGENVINVTS
jgi:hypothetical protein